ncbi:MAG: DUF1570 domain-containing protein [Gemmataceae bacterium]|nr:DUF1570 domain-containing protein [Gemmataceae bacterium]
MNTTALALLCCGLLPGQPTNLPNLDFSHGNLAGWQGEGFSRTTLKDAEGDRAPGVSSSDARNPRRKGLLRYVFTMPEGAVLIRFHAHAVLAEGCKADGQLDVLLLGVKNRVVPRLVRTPAGWEASSTLLPPQKGQPREYAWDVSALAGQRLQIAIVDHDERAGCHVVCGGFHLEQADTDRREFARFMTTLARDRKLPSVTRHESRHFTAWSNADRDFTDSRLRDCEQLYSDFFRHFTHHSFTLRPPPGKLMVAVFDSPTGFEAYLGKKVPANLVGVYHTNTNRLVIYDLARNRGVAESKEKALAKGRRLPLEIDRVLFTEEIERQTQAYVQDANIAVTMHEAAHLLSFNCGLLNRKGDVPAWVVEGLACYCEPADKGSWQGIGAPNPERLRVLARQLRGEARTVPLATLIGSDAWLKDGSAVLSGYAQSWALFRMLMQERSEALRSYLTLIHPRRAPEHRLTDFREVFGADLVLLERRHREYIRALVEQHGPR